MKAYIGNYTTWIGPYQIAEKLLFWMDKDDDRVHNFGRWLAYGTTDEKTETWLYKFCEWIESKRKRVIYVKIDKWDTYSLDSTLAHIILPALEQLKVTTHGSAFVDDSDVPENIRSTSAKPKENEYDIDEFHHDRWIWVLNEMIFAFESKIEDSWKDKYYTGEIDYVTVPVDQDGNEVDKENAAYFEYKKGPNNTFKCDEEGLKKHQERISNGFRLFGKYYEGLWD